MSDPSDAPPAKTVEAAAPHASTLPSSTKVAGQLPPLLQDKAFWGMSITQFLGAFNDNLFKQLLLLLATPTAIELAAARAAGDTVPDRQSDTMIVFAVAFLLFSGFAGWLADRTSKRTLIIAAKIAEIGVMILGMIGFLLYGTIGFSGMLVVLFFMGTQSAFFGPPKYGILPEMIRDRDLPQANGIFLMFTFVAIIFGTVLAGKLGPEGAAEEPVAEAAEADAAPQDEAAAEEEKQSSAAIIWRASAVCISIAVLGTLTSLLVRRVPPANPTARLRWYDFVVPPEAIRLVRRDTELLFALLVTSSFWLLGSIVQQSVNALGKSQLGLDNESTSILAAMLGVGIPIGCLIGGKLSAGKINPRVVAGGAFGIVATLGLLSLRGGGAQNHLLGFYGSIPVLVAAGISTGIFIVPIQVAVQALPPANEKGRMIALMNQCNWIGIIIGALLFKGTVLLCETYEQPRNTAFAVGALVMLPIAIFYRPKEQILSE